MKKITNFFISLFFVVLSFYFSVNLALADMLPPGDKFYKVPKNQRKEILEIITPKYVFLGIIIIIATIYSFSLIYKIRNGEKIFSFSKKKSKKSFENEEEKTKGIFSKFEVFALMILAGATAGSIPTAAKIAMSTGLNPLALLFFRYLIAFSCMFLVVLERKEISWEDAKNNFLPSFLAVMNPIALFYALVFKTTASVSILIYAIGPSLVALYHIFYGGKINRNQFIGLSAGFVGVALILLQPISKGGVGSIEGNLLAFLATIFFVSYTIFAGKKQVEKLASPYSLIFYSSIIAMMISFFPMLENIQKVNLELKQILAIGWLGVVSTVIFFSIYQYIVKKEGILVASVYAYLQATIGAIIGIVVLKEEITNLVVIGAILTFIGSKITTMKVAEKKEEPKKVLNRKIVRKVRNQDLKKEEILKLEDEKSSLKTEDLKSVKKKTEKIDKIEKGEEIKK